MAASSLNLDANELADEIMIQITPFVSSSLEQEAQKASALSEDQVVQIIITDLKPTGKSYFLKNVFLFFYSFLDFFFGYFFYYCELFLRKRLDKLFEF